MKITFVGIGVFLIGFLLPELLVAFTKVREVPHVWNVVCAIALTLIAVGLML